MKRYLHDQILDDLKKKMVFLTGPRQVGKTTLARHIIESFRHAQYLNLDDVDDRRIIQHHAWRPDVDLLVFDELHKMPGWKRFIKGVFDTRPEGLAILVTGSARMDYFRHTGESLAGRYLPLRLHPLSVRELTATAPPASIAERLTTLGPFPEPYLSGSVTEADRWRRQYLTAVVIEEATDLAGIREVRTMRSLLAMLQTRVGTPVSYTALARDLQVSPNTVRKYVAILESLFIIFPIHPYHKNVGRSLLKRPKIYFYDTAAVKGDEGVVWENLVAQTLLKVVHYRQDVEGKDVNLHYIRTRDGREVDFVLSEEETLTTLIEVKYSDRNPSKTMRSLLERFPESKGIQLVYTLRRDEFSDRLSILRGPEYLASLPA